MTSAQQALQLRRQAIGFERMANRAAQTDKPWTDKNVRLYSGRMYEAELKRSKIIRSYLSARAGRGV
jgi:hypothetical protein